MPTPKGLPRKGDKLRHASTSETVTVVKREGNDIQCSVIVSRDNGKPSSSPPYGYPRNHLRITEFMYWLQTGTYVWVEEP